MAPRKTTVSWLFKVSVFTCSVITLSWIFAGCRQVMQFGRLSDWVLLIAGLSLTLAFLAIQGYWIYFEEKAKGTLKKYMPLFETINIYMTDLTKNRHKTLLNMSKKRDSKL